MERTLKKRIFGYILSGLIFIVLTGYLIYHLIFYSSNDIVTEFAYPVTERIYLSADAYVLRNEKLINSDSSAVSASFVFNDGDKVSKNAVLGSIYSSQTDSHGDALIEIDKQIDFLQKSSVDNTFMTSDTASLDKKIENLYHSTRLSLNDCDVGASLALSNEMLTLMNRRMIITGESSGFKDQVEQLQRQRERYASSYGDNERSLFAETSGYFYSSCDGYENIFTADKALSMSYDEFENMILESPDSEASNAICKIAYDYRWYLSCPVKKTDLKSFNVGRSYTIVFETKSSHLSL